ncbi:hypothetical protein J2Z70_003549 [Paenibacillus silagei]|uniref:Uncharacterized protein n=2 Tax=Paenibacillus silagei TaxID=1670801 RepID=A0ABS4NTK7_9BACL|nr:hypothetical protein [Paenibacillus silagei]
MIHDEFVSLFNSKSSDFLDSIVIYYHSLKSTLTQNDLQQLFEILETTPCRLINEFNRFKELYFIMSPQIRQKVLHILLSFNEIKTEEIEMEIENLYQKVINKEEFTYCLVKGIFHCDSESVLISIKTKIQLELIEKMVDQKLAIISYDKANLFSIDVEDYLNTVPDSYKDLLKKIIERSNEEVVSITNKLTSLWTHEYVDSKNSTLSDYALSDKIAIPQKIYSKINAKSRFTVGKGFGCMLTNANRALLYDLNTKKANEIILSGKVVSGPVLINNMLAIGQDDEFSVFGKDGVNRFMDFVEGNIISIKSINDYVYFLTDYGKIYEYNNSGTLRQILNLDDSEIYIDILLLDKYLVVVSTGKLNVFYYSEQNPIYVSDFLMEDIKKVIAFNDICFVMTETKIIQVLISSQITIAYTPLTEMKNNHMLAESPNSIVILINSRLVRIVFENGTTSHSILFEAPNNKLITDAINCNGTYALILNDKEIVTLRQQEGIYEISSEYMLDDEHSEYVMSSGYGSLFITSTDNLYQISNMSPSQDLKEGNEYVA